MRLDTVQIRRKTKIALPSDDAYLFRLCVALYGFASINSFMTEIICHIDKSKNRTELLELQSGRVLDTFRQTRKLIYKQGLYPAIHTTMQQTADLFEQLNSERSDFVHAYPITGQNEQQILHRRHTENRKYFEVDNNFLDSFISRLSTVNKGLYEIRGVVRPNL